MAVRLRPMHKIVRKIKRPKQSSLSLHQVPTVIILMLVTLCINYLLLGCRHKLQLSNTDYDVKLNYTQPNKSITVEVLSSQRRVYFIVNEIEIFGSREDDGRGLYVLVLNQGTGAIMAQRVFDIYLPNGDDAFIEFLETLSSGRILMLAIKDEATFHMKHKTRELLNKLGSKHGPYLGWRDMWAAVLQKDGKVFGESCSKSANFQAWGLPVQLKTEIILFPSEGECYWPETEENEMRKIFCNRFEGYDNVCNCTNPASLDFKPPQISNNQVRTIPVVVVASNRPYYLYKLRSLMSAHGVNPEMVTIFIDGDFEEPTWLVRYLFGLKLVHHKPTAVKKIARVSQHYKSVFTTVFSMYTDARYAIILEEDLMISPDLFSQTIRLLDEDPTIYCISAWNDQGYSHTTADPRLLYRIETMPGLGWILKRSLYEELAPIWPNQYNRLDWDLWMRSPKIRKNRECIIPDISRTYHFGESGVNINPATQNIYFKSHAFNNHTDEFTFKDVDSVKKEQYEEVIKNLLEKATILDHSRIPCENDFLPNTKGKIYVVFFNMAHGKDYSTWYQIAKCLKIWDRDPRGFHKSMLRIFWKENHLLIIGTPNSPYSIYKPANVTPIDMRLGGTH